MNSRRSTTVLAVTLFLVASYTSASSNVFGQTLHAIIAGDISPSAQWGKYEASVSMDMSMMMSTLTVNVPERNLNISYLPMRSDADSTPATLLGEISNLSVASGDTLMLLFSGHGGQDEKGHYLALAKGKLHREVLINALTAKRARLTILLTDCCNTRSDGELFIAPNLNMEPAPRVTPIAHELLFAPQGLVDINSSAPGESSFFVPILDNEPLPGGSLFTSALANWFIINQQRRRNWDDLVREVGLEVHQSFHDFYPKGATAGKGQPVQQQQTIYPRSYPGMPAKSGPRTGFVVRDYAGVGAMINRIEPGSPAAQVYELRSKEFRSLQPQQVITAINGKNIQSIADVQTAIDASPQIVRLTIRDPRQGLLEVLLRMRY